MKKSERIALDTFLSSYPHEIEYQSVISMIMKSSKKIDIWEPFEHYPLENIIEWIDNLREHIAMDFEYIPCPACDYPSKHQEHICLGLLMPGYEDDSQIENYEDRRGV